MRRRTVDLTLVVRLELWGDDPVADPAALAAWAGTTLNAFEGGRYAFPGELLRHAVDRAAGPGVHVTTDGEGVRVSAHIPQEGL